MNCRRLIRLSLAACVSSLLAMPVVAQTTQPAPAQAEPAVPAAPAQVDPKAAELISQMKSAYGKLTALDVAGKISGNFDVAGQRIQRSQEFTGSFAAPNKFRHQSKEGLLLGSTGEKVYAYSPGENMYVTTDAANKSRFENVPPPTGDMLFGENPSILLAVLQDPMRVFAGSTVTRAPDVTVDAKSYPALHVSGRPTAEELTLLIDPATKLLRRVTTDLTRPIAQRGATDIKAAEFIVDYTTTTVDAEPNPEQFAWAPPEGARDAAAQASADGPRGESAALEGKPAPDFTLPDLGGREVKLADLKGKVVVLDFWAIWCPPCVAALPGLDQFAKQQGPDGAQVFAINLQDEKDRVQAFVKERNLSLPVLLDFDGKVGEAYKAEPIPQTVIIGKDGNVRRVLIGAGHGKTIEQEVEAALKAR